MVIIVTEKYFKIVEDPKFTRSVSEVSRVNFRLIDFPCYMFLDQSSKTGIVIFDSKKRLITSVYLEKIPDESMVEYRMNLKSLVGNLIDKYRVSKVFCEDVYGGCNFETVETLVSIKAVIEDIAYEKGVKFYSLNNRKWKSRLSYPKKWDYNVGDKKQVDYYVRHFYPTLKLNEHEIDALGMGIAVLFKTKEGMRPLEMRLDKKLPIEREVFVVEKFEDIYKIIDQSRKNKVQMLEVKEFEYDEKLDLDTNFRYLLTNHNVLGVCEIPYHRYYGQILLEFNIKPSEIPEGGLLVGVGNRKRWK